MFFAVVSPGHLRSQVEPEQLTEQLPVQVTWQVELEPQETLPLLPTVTVHSDDSQLTLPLSPVVRLQLLFALQSALHEPAQVPVQVLAPVQASEQDEPLLLQPVAVLPVQVQLPLLQVHDEPLQGQLGPGQGVAAGGVDPHAKANEESKPSRVKRTTR